MTDRHAPLEAFGQHFRTRLRYGKGLRQRFTIALTDERKAQERADKLQELANALSRAGKSAEAPLLLKRGGEVTTDRDLADVLKVADELCRKANRAALTPRRVTFRELAERWTSGKLSEKWPDHIRAKRSASDDEGRLTKHVYPVVGDVALSDFTLDHAERVMASLPTALSPASRRQVAQLIHRVLAMAVYPERHITHSPIPRGWLPKPGNRKAWSILYPKEDAILLSDTTIPLGYRLLYGFLHREGMRRDEALRLTWDDVDLEHGSVRLSENKTDTPRFWKLGPGVIDALKEWKKRSASSELVFGLETGDRLERERLADLVRTHLKAAGLTRRDLFEQTKTRGRFGTHSFRRSFVTRVLAAGKTEDWVRQRTGHKSAELLRYRQQANSLAELELGDVRPLCEAIPEFAGRHEDGPRPGHDASEPGLSVNKIINDSDRVREKGLEPSRITTPEPKSHHSVPGATEQQEIGLAAPPEKAPEHPMARPNLDETGPSNDIELTLAYALRAATNAEQWDVVRVLAAELSARRLARVSPEVTDLEVERARRGGST
jgi:integrase